MAGKEAEAVRLHRRRVQLGVGTFENQMFAESLARGRDLMFTKCHHVFYCAECCTYLI